MTPRGLSYQNITPNGFFTLGEIEKIVTADGFEPILEGAEESLEAIRERMLEAISQGTLSEESDEYQFASALNHLQMSIELLKGIHNREVVVLNDPKILSLFRIAEVQSEIIAKPEMDAFHPIRHLAPSIHGGEMEYSQSEPLFYDKRTYLTLPQALPVRNLAEASIGYSYHLNKPDFLEALSALETYYWESGFKDDPAFAALPRLFDFFHRKDIKKQIENQGFSPNYS